MKTICLWCGKSHKIRRPKRCRELGKLMSEAAKEVEVWVLMRMLEVYGADSLKNWRALVPQFAKNFTKRKRSVKKLAVTKEAS